MNTQRLKKLQSIIASSQTTSNMGCCGPAILNVAGGGTGVSTLTTGRFLVGDGYNPVDLSKVCPIGEIVGTTDIQTITNKTITDGSNVVSASQITATPANIIISSTPPSVGQVLTATSATNK
jgi:hypothetical protein